MDLMSLCTYAQDSVLVIVHMDMLRFSFPSCLCTVRLIQSCDTSVFLDCTLFKTSVVLCAIKCCLNVQHYVSICKKNYNTSVAQLPFKVARLIAL